MHQAGSKRSTRSVTTKAIPPKGVKRSRPVKPASTELSGVVWNKLDCAPQLNLSKDALTVTGEKGFRMVRANVGVREGHWYYECEILPPSSNEGHVRLGWAAITGELEAPVGYDNWSFGFRDINGAKIHKSERFDGYGEAFGPGDVIGCEIYIPPENNQFAGGLCGLSSSGLSVQGKPNTPKSMIKMYINGIDQGIAFSAIPPRTYYPAVSLYGGGRIRANFGPTWIYPPPIDVAESDPDITPLKSLSLLKPLSKLDAAAHVEEIVQRRSILAARSQNNKASSHISETSPTTVST